MVDHGRPWWFGVPEFQTNPFERIIDLVKTCQNLRFHPFAWIRSFGGFCRQRCLFTEGRDSNNEMVLSLSKIEAEIAD